MKTLPTIYCKMFLILMRAGGSQLSAAVSICNLHTNHRLQKFPVEVLTVYMTGGKELHIGNPKNTWAWIWRPKRYLASKLPTQKIQDFNTSILIYSVICKKINNQLNIMLRFGKLINKETLFKLFCLPWVTNQWMRSDFRIPGHLFAYLWTV